MVLLKDEDQAGVQRVAPEAFAVDGHAVRKRLIDFQPHNDLLLRRGLLQCPARNLGVHQEAVGTCLAQAAVAQLAVPGQNAAVIAVQSGSGYMSTILRRDGLIYNVDYDKVSLELVANSEREFPKDWIAPNRFDVTDDFVNYARPLIGEDWVSVPVINGVQRFAKFEEIFADQKLAKYIPQAYKK